MEPLQNISTYQEFKAATDREVYNQAEGFVRLGYLLRRAEDTDILEESGYRTVTEFAKAEYGLTETYVSRYMNINRRYSEGGYSDRLQEQFRGFGLAKLADMLTLPDGIVETIPVEATRTEIQEIKKEYTEEQRVSDLEILAEQQGEGNGEGQQEEGLLAKMLKGYYHENPEEYREIHGISSGENWNPSGGNWKRDLMEAMAPAGTAVKMARVAGTGRMMLTVKSMEQNLELLNIRNGQKESHSWEELKGCLTAMCMESVEEDWERLYHEPYPSVPEPKEKEPEKPKRKTASVVSIAKPREKKPEKRPEEKPQQKEPEKQDPERQQEQSGERQQEPHKENAKLAPVQEGERPPEEPGDREELSGAPESRESPVKIKAQEERGCVSYEDSMAEYGMEGPQSRKEPETETGKNRNMVIDGEFVEVTDPETAEAETGREDGRTETLIEEAEEYLQSIRTALEKRYYAMAKADAKHLAETLEELCRELDRKPMKGQHEMSEYMKE